MKKALITGSNGFIGQHLSRALKKINFKVIEFSRQQNRQVTIPEDFATLPKVDVVFHLAAISGYKDCNANTSLAYQVNVGGTVNVLEYCRRVKAKLVFPSTYVYDTPYVTYKKESDPAKPMTHYSFTKWLGEELCRFYSRVYQIDTVIARTSNVYGPGQDTIYIVPVIRDHLLENKELTLTKPDVERSFIYIDDLVQAYMKLALAKTPPGEIFNIGPKLATRLQELVDLLVKITGKPAKIHYSGQGRSNETNINQVDITKIQKIIGWQPKVSLEAGLQKLQRSNYL